MADLLAGWLRQLTADGLYLIPPDGSRRAWISLRQRVTPLQTFSRAVLAAAPLLPAELRDPRTWSEPRRSLSIAGDPVMSLSIHGSLASGDAFAAELAAIYTGPDYVWLHGSGHGEYASQIPAIVGALARYLYIGRPAIRHRWFRYAPPKGWAGVRRRHHTLWVPRDPELRPAFVCVLDAVPRAEPITVMLDDGIEISTAAPAAAAVRSHTVGSIRADLHVAAPGDGTRTLTDARIEDSTFAYVVRLAARTERTRTLEPTLMALVDSIERVAMPTSPPADAYQHLWPE